MATLTRRSFVRRTLAAAATVTVAGTKSSGRVLGANDVIRVGVAGIHGQGNAPIEQYLGLTGVQVTHLIDPDRCLWESRGKPITAKYGTLDPTAERFAGDGAGPANAFLTREYRKPFVVPERV